MRIACPYCGERDVREFSYFGDAAPRRPDPAAPDARQRFADYVYLRDNPAGLLREYWYHSAGCQMIVVVTRDVRDHAILRVSPIEAPAAAASDEPQSAGSTKA